MRFFPPTFLPFWAWNDGRCHWCDFLFITSAELSALFFFENFFWPPKPNFLFLYSALRFFFGLEKKVKWGVTVFARWHRYPWPLLFFRSPKDCSNSSIPPFFPNERRKMFDVGEIAVVSHLFELFSSFLTIGIFLLDVSAKLPVALSCRTNVVHAISSVFRVFRCRLFDWRDTRGSRTIDRFVVRRVEREKKKPFSCVHRISPFARNNPPVVSSRCFPLLNVESLGEPPLELDDSWTTEVVRVEMNEERGKNTKLTKAFHVWNHCQLMFHHRSSEVQRRWSSEARWSNPFVRPRVNRDKSLRISRWALLYCWSMDVSLSVRCLNPVSIDLRETLVEAEKCLFGEHNLFSLLLRSVSFTSASSIS